jgi:hypothetical protein
MTDNGRTQSRFAGRATAPGRRTARCSTSGIARSAESGTPCKALPASAHQRKAFCVKQMVGALSVVVPA